MKIKIIGAILLVLCLCGCACNPGGSITSGSDVSDPNETIENISENWTVSPDDTTYLSAMKLRVEWVLTRVTELDERMDEFSEYGRADRLERAREYREIRDELKGWCSAAQSYPEDKLTSDLAKNVYAKTIAFAQQLSDYLDVYPQIAVGDISGDEAKNSLVDAAIELYGLLWA